jgi:hypothetical protein
MSAGVPPATLRKTRRLGRRAATPLAKSSAAGSLQPVRLRLKRRNPTPQLGDD